MSCFGNLHSRVSFVHSSRQSSLCLNLEQKETLDCVATVQFHRYSPSKAKFPVYLLIHNFPRSYESSNKLVHLNSKIFNSKKSEVENMSHKRAKSLSGEAFQTLSNGTDKIASIPDSNGSYDGLDLNNDYPEEFQIQLNYINGSSPWLGETPSLVKSTVEDILSCKKKIKKEEEERSNSPEPGNKSKREIAWEQECVSRDAYNAIEDSEMRIQIFCARQIGVRMLNCLAYLCPTCWLPKEDCICERIKNMKKENRLWKGITFWLYMHPKEYLRKNNTGKLLCQLLGEESVHLCIYGIKEHETFMWNAFRKDGIRNVFCLYPPRNASDTDVRNLQIPIEEIVQEEPKEIENQNQNQVDGSSSMHFVLIDGTWSNSKAMINRLLEHSFKEWGENMKCVYLSLEEPSVMHGLRPQPSKDRTCTAAAAAALLLELHQRSELRSLGLADVVQTLDLALATLRQALSRRRLRSGRTELRLGSKFNFIE